jgi:non-lysosomal glucosylceramidase
MTDIFLEGQEDFETAKKYGFRYNSYSQINGYKAKHGSHDDGPFHGPFLGGIGTGTYSRDLVGNFSRWHMQPGFHVHQIVPQAKFLLRWDNEKEKACNYVGIGKQPGWNEYVPVQKGFKESEREYAVLFPDCYEYYSGDQYPFKLIFHYWSPLLYDSTVSSFPVVYYSIYLKNVEKKKLTISAAHFWPNIVGWRVAPVTTIDRGGDAWPAHTHANNFNRNAEFYESQEGVGIVQSKRFKGNPTRDMEGEILVGVTCNKPGQYSREVCFKADQNAIGVDPINQKFTQAWVENYFSEYGYLPETSNTWDAHWHEPLSSAVSFKCQLEQYESVRIDFFQVFDLPLVSFGSDRGWYKKYTETFGFSGKNSERIAIDAINNREFWKTEIRKQKEKQLQVVSQKGITDRVGGSVLNELFFLTGGGSVWTNMAYPSQKLDKPVLGENEHFAFLEGYDTGYFYYNTFDLWLYAFSAVTASWPSLANSIFKDYLKAAKTPNNKKRIVYRVMEERQMLASGKIPHDLGNPLADPWHELNGYIMRDDPNIWRDHNPAFIIAYYLFLHMTQQNLQLEEWDTIKKIAQYLFVQDEDNDGLVEHKEFGDSTWDALNMRGVSSFSGGLTLAAYAALVEFAKSIGDSHYEKIYQERLIKGMKSFQNKLWTGEYYRTDSDGGYKNCVMIDALIGPFLAELSGLKPVLPRDQVISHLEKAYEYNFIGYKKGVVGPLLVADGSGNRFTPDGGEELQINEVLVGSAWVFCSMLYNYGLHKEATSLSNVLHKVLYEKSGLQFRTPAAWDADCQFRAPLNMRPLAVGLLNYISQEEV